MEINDQTIAIYRDIYYEHEKPLLKAAKTEEEFEAIEDALLPILISYGWTMNIYNFFKMTDLMQRIAYLNDVSKLQGKKPNIFLQAGNDILPTENSYKVPELRCPIRSEEKRNLN